VRCRSGKSVRTRKGIRNKNLDAVPVLCYGGSSTINLDGSEKNMGSEPNFDLGGRPVKVENGNVLDPRLIRIVQAIARCAAEEDFEAALKLQHRENA
jgi:hypothetical protein